MITEPEDKDDVLQWRFDVNTFRLIGRDLITDRITAVFELVKNCYDANATEVTVDFRNVSAKTPDRTIVIRDNGTGMSFLDIKNKWMVVGTNSKRTQLYSDPPFNRKFVGEKGIGRFAVDKLGERLLIKTKEVGSEKWLNVTINWDAYEAKEKQATRDNQLSLFTDITNEYFYEDGVATDHGTELIISQVSDGWTEKDIERLYKELSRLVSPFYPLNPPFDVFINSNEFKHYTNAQVKPDPVKFFSHQAEIDYDLDAGKQGTLKFNLQTGNIDTESVDIKSFGPIKMKLYYFNEAAKKRYNAAYKNDDTRIDGIKIYRDGVIATPFAEFEPETEKRRDILGIDKRRWRGTFEKIATREIIGVVDITKKDNPNIVDATNRQDFIDNVEYRQLKEFIIQQLSAFEALKEYERSEKRSVVVKELSDAGKDVKQLERQLEKVEQDIANSPPEVKENVTILKQQVQRLHTTISKGIDEQKKFQREVARKEKILYSIVSMQEYASLIAHAVRTSIAKVKHLGEFFKRNYPNPKFEQIFIKYAGLIYDEMNTLVVVTDFMLSYASSDKYYEEFNVKSLITDLLEDSYKEVFQREGIKLEIDIRDDFIIDTNKKTFQDIFQNLVSNSIKALRNIDDKKIKCTGYLDTNNFVIYFSDNGSGIADSDIEWIFGLYNTRTAEQGGAGVGLYIVEKQVKALGGSIEVVDNEFKPTGATFKITIPFSKS
ncbi:sensor histidine kinase [Mucilaginibacter gotjawali]|uniref:Signal transduction histidine kinase n=2 Tax=Mucilaginibacter gotjawali TaxID=1550579 RepID=A0A839SLQ4_9SPHI|nr:sensor histidine kinase [Mucilaginibacter gotjawali]MBB3057377.1 signal transduction histidine kinase [Mucilaginibacter gotjawali]BAU55504.1 Sensor protein ZraS [Mucilaginibacter gotjawali]